MSSTTRTVGLIAIGAAIVGALVYVTYREEPVPVDLVEVTRGPMFNTINADGKTEIREVYDVAAPINGTALRSPVDVGDAVTGGQTVVAVVEPVAPSLLDERSRIQAEAAVREAEASLHVSESELRQAQEDLAYARSQLERISTLVERGVSSITQLEDATQIVALREAALDAAQSRLDMTRSALDRARAALIEPTGQTEGSAACCVRIRAPIDGVVLSVDVVSERPVVAGERLLTLGDPDRLEIVADLLSSDAVRLEIGAEAIVERWGGPTPLSARLRSVEPIARTKVSALGIEEQRVDATFDIASPPEEREGLGHGFSVFLRIVEWRADDVTQVPLSALFRAGTEWAVFVARDETAHRVIVETGRRNGSAAEILDGLEPGERIVTHPGDDVRDGAPIMERNAL